MDGRADMSRRGESEACTKIILWFFSFPNRKTTLSGISEEVGMSKTTASAAVAKLVKNGFLERRVLGRSWEISCDRDHPYFHGRKVGYNIAMIFESGVLEQIHDIVPSPKAVVLFGSYRWGGDDEKSDIDIAVEVPGSKEMRIVELAPVRIGHRKSVPVNAHIFSRSRIDLNLFANIANGIVLEGFLEARP